MNPHRHFLTLARYHVWATSLLLDAVAPLSDDDYRRDLGLFFKSMHGTLNHLLVCEYLLWLRRFAEGVSPKLTLSDEAESDRAQLAARLRDGAARWQPLIESWPADHFDGAFNYINMRGQRASLPFAAALTHVFNHGTHHRGQISAALTRLGQPCPELDFVYMLQQEMKAHD